MLQAANQDIRHCYERALEAEQRAANARNSEERRFYLDNEKRWLALAVSYEYQERLTAFLQELRGHVNAPLCPACGLPMRPKRLVQTAQRLFEFQFRCPSCGTTRTVSDLR